MITVISPAKSLDFESPLVTKQKSQPLFLDESKKLITQLKKLAPQDIASLMKLSDKLAQLNYDRFQTFKPPFTLDNARQAMLAFKGDVYQGLNAESFNASDFKFAQKHLRILSGLYEKELSKHKQPILLNLASNEYFKAINTKSLGLKVVSAQFKDYKNGQFKIISFYAKKARGLMSQFIIKNQIDSPEKLKQFDLDGYYFDKKSSTQDELIFLRQQSS